MKEWEREARPGVCTSEAAEPLRRERALTSQVESLSGEVPALAGGWSRPGAADHGRCCHTARILAFPILLVWLLRGLALSYHSLRLHCPPSHK